jgi:hypothetical protein
MEGRGEGGEAQGVADPPPPPKKKSQLANEPYDMLPLRQKSQQLTEFYLSLSSLGPLENRSPVIKLFAGRFKLTFGASGGGGGGSPAVRVIRLAEFSPRRRLFTLGSFLNYRNGP